MAFSGGVYTLPTPALVPGQTVSSSENNTVRNDMAASFNLTFLRNGTSTATANLPMGGYKLTGLGVATTLGDALSYNQAAVVSNLTDTALTITRVPYVSTGGLLIDSANFTFDGTTLTAAGFAGPLTGNVTGNVSGNAGTVTNGVYTSGDQTIGGTKTFSSNPILSGGTANGVAYLNGSKVLTTGSALTFDGTNFVTTGTAKSSGYLFSTNTGLINTDATISNYAGTNYVYINGNNTSGGGLNLNADGTRTTTIGLVGGGSNYMWFQTSGSEQMRLTSTGLGIGTSSPGAKLDVFGATTSTARITGGSGGSDTARRATLELLASGSKLYAIQASALDGSLQIQDSGTARLTLDSSGNVGIGTSSPTSFGAGAVMMTVAGTSAYGGYLANTTSVQGQFWSFEEGGAVYCGARSNHPLIITTNNTERMRIDSSGNLLVGTTSVTGKITSYTGASGIGVTGEFTGAGGNSIGLSTKFSNTSGEAWHCGFNYNGSYVGSIRSNSTTTSYVTSSDYRLKENVQPMQNALAVVEKLNPVTYTWKADGSDGQGFIAHELQAVVPDCVTGEKDAVDEEGKPVYQGIDTSFLVATLTKAIQELKAELDATKAEVAALKGN